MAWYDDIAVKKWEDIFPLIQKMQDEHLSVILMVNTQWGYVDNIIIDTKSLDIGNYNLCVGQNELTIQIESDGFEWAYSGETLAELFDPCEGLLLNIYMEDKTVFSFRKHI